MPKDKKRQKEAKQKKLYEQKKKDEFFVFTDTGFPFDLKKEIQTLIKKYRLTNRQWKKIDDGDVLAYVCEMLSCSLNKTVFGKYFPRLTPNFVTKFHAEKIVGGKFDNKCFITCNKLERVLIDGKEYFDIGADDKIDIPRFCGKKILFTKHACERLVSRSVHFDDEHSHEEEADATIISLFLSNSITIMSRSELSIKESKGQHFLYSDGVTILDKSMVMGYFPLTVDGDYAIAKTFLYDNWV